MIKLQHHQLQEAGIFAQFIIARHKSVDEILHFCAVCEGKQIQRLQNRTTKKNTNQKRSRKLSVGALNLGKLGSLHECAST